LAVAVAIESAQFLNAAHHGLDVAVVQRRAQRTLLRVEVADVQIHVDVSVCPVRGARALFAHLENQRANLRGVR
jgi:hypothetical protein